MSNPFTMPAFPPDLAETISAHRRLFAGWTMTAGAIEDRRPRPRGGEPATGLPRFPIAGPSPPARG
jgi:hypothetical protein